MTLDMKQSFKNYDSNKIFSVSCSNFVGQDLDGVLPPSVAKLRHLRELYGLICFSCLLLTTYSIFILIAFVFLAYSYLGQNDLSGTIPREWAFTKLEIL